MRNVLIAGTAVLFVTLGAASAYAVPQNSPYATMVPPGAVDGYQPDNGPTYIDPNYAYGNEPMVEGRAAEVDPYYNDPGYIYPDYGVAPLVGGGFFFGGGRHFDGGGFHGGHFGGGHFGGGGHIHNAR
jgi:hypothetical protein